MEESMREPIVPYVSLHDLPDDLADADGWCLGGGLCCPDDPLDAVMQLAPPDDDGLLEALGIDAWPPPPSQELRPRVARGEETVESKNAPPGMDDAGGDAGMGCGERGARAASLPPRVEGGTLLADMGAGGALETTVVPSGGERGVRAALWPPKVDGDTLLVDMGAGGALESTDGGERNVRAALWPPKVDGAMLLADMGAGGALQTVAPSGAAPVLPARAATTTPASSLAASNISWRHPSSTTWETESPPVRVAPYPLHGLVVPTRRRHGPVSRRKGCWPSFLLDDAAPAAAPHVPPSDSNNGNVVGGGIRRRVQARRQRRRPSAEGRVCSHCEASETPQWRAGPDGPGTLCNACGIRFGMHKKLLPEYRPSTSPSFRSGKHSSRHRKVVKLREQKEKAMMLEVNAAAAPMVVPPQTMLEFRAAAPMLVPPPPNHGEVHR